MFRCKARKKTNREAYNLTVTRRIYAERCGLQRNKADERFLTAP
jgi:hypothetical protein